MSANRSLLDPSGGFSRPVGRHTSVRSVIILAVVIFLAELVTMAVLYYLEIPNYFLNSLLDGLIMVLLILPGLYYLQLNPLLKHVEERSRAEGALRSSEELMRKVLELLPVGVWIIDKDKQVAHNNPASRKIWAAGESAGFEHLGEFRGWHVETGRLIGNQEWAAARAINQGETTLNEEVEIKAFDGTRKIILNSAVPILDERGEIQGAVVVDQDITHRKSAEIERIRTNELLERFFSSISTLIAYMDRDFNFIRVNEAYARSGGHPPEYFRGKNHFDLYPNEENLAIFRKVVETGEPFSALEKPFEYAEYPERGVTYWDWSLQPVKGADGKIEGVVLSLVDVTARKYSEIILEQRNQELRALYEAETAARRFAETLSDAAQALNQSLEVDHVVNTLLDYLSRMVPSDTAGVTLFESESRPALHSLRGYGRWAEMEVVPSFPYDGITDSVVHRLVQARRSLTIPNLTMDSPAVPQMGEGLIRFWLVVPIIASDKVIGWVELGKADGEFTFEHARWAESFVAQAAVALQNAWLFQQVRTSSERLQTLAHKLVKVQENERYHIARELHDEAGQVLSSLKMGLGRLEQDPSCPEHMKKRLRELKGTADGVLEGLHRLAMDLRPVTLDHLGLVAALEQYVSNLLSDRLTVQFKAVGFDHDRLPRDVETSLYRIVQESLTNVLCHAHASHVGILLERTADRVRLFVEDDGIGFSPDIIEHTDRLGLVGMRERADMLGGSLTIESTPGRGTSIIVEVPNVYPDPYRG